MNSMSDFFFKFLKSLIFIAKYSASGIDICIEWKFVSFTEMLHSSGIKVSCTEEHVLRAFYYLYMWLAHSFIRRTFDESNYNIQYHV